MPNILCFGDSLTWCFNPENWERYPYEVRWTTILQNKLGNEYKILVDGLNGRTTCWNHPYLPHRNGTEQFPISLEVNAPLDLVIVMLGVNDMTKTLKISAQESAVGLIAYLRAVNECGAVNDSVIPKMLIIAPPHLGKVNNFMNMWYLDNIEESKKLAKCIKIFCDEFEIPFLDSNEFVQACDIDGVHISIESNKILGETIADKVLEIMNGTNKP